MLLVDHLRTGVGLPMGSILPPMAGSRHCGWTTDGAKAAAAREAGASVTTCPACSAGGVTGYEVTCAQGAEVEQTP
jgi:cytosine/adenosine deaminase-related metal-dependent hydrolase